MRAHLSLLFAGAALLLGGCERAVATGQQAGASAAPTVAVRQPPPAAEAGGVCALLDYGRVDDALGVRFDVAAAAKQGGTQTCVVRTSETDLPDLVITVSPTTADARVFRSDMAPEGALKVAALGKAAYRSGSKAAKGRGPMLEVGWLGADKRLVTLRFTLPAGTPAVAAEWNAPRLVSLAKVVEAARRR